MMQNVHKEIRDFNQDDELKTLILTSCNDNFCSGADMKEVMENVEQPNYVEEYFGLLFDLKEELQSSQKNTISFIDGYGIGGGLAFGLSSKIIVCTERAKLGLSGSRVGLGTFSSCVRESPNYYFQVLANSLGFMLSPFELRGSLVDDIIHHSDKEVN